MDHKMNFGACALAVLGLLTFGLTGCVTVTDSKGNSQTLGQFVDSFRPAGAQSGTGGQAAPTASAAAPASTNSPAAAAPVAAVTTSWAAGQEVPLDWSRSGSGYFPKTDPLLMVPADVPGTNTAYWKAESGCRVMAPYYEDVDVDTAYARAMRRWQFLTPETVAMRQANNSTFTMHKDYRHERQAGSFYRLAQDLRYAGPSQEVRKFFLDLSLSKEGPHRTRVDAVYCVRPHVDRFDMTSAGHGYIQQMVRGSVKA